MPFREPQPPHSLVKNQCLDSGVSLTTDTSSHSFWKSVANVERAELLVGGWKVVGKEIRRMTGGIRGDDEGERVGGGAWLVEAEDPEMAEKSSVTDLRPPPKEPTTHHLLNKNRKQTRHARIQFVVIKKSSPFRLL